MPIVTLTALLTSTDGHSILMTLTCFQPSWTRVWKVLVGSFTTVLFSDFPPLWKDTALKREENRYVVLLLGSGALKGSSTT